MNRLLSMLCIVTCVLTFSHIRADEVLLPEESAVVEEAEVEAKPPTQVGQASTDGTNAARKSQVGKYALAAGAIAVGVAALILVSRHNGHHPHH